VVNLLTESSVVILSIKISQGNVVMHVSWDGNFYYGYIWCFLTDLPV